MFSFANAAYIGLLKVKEEHGSDELLYFVVEGEYIQAWSIASFANLWLSIILTFGLPRGGGTHPLRFFRCHTFSFWNKILKFSVAVGVHFRTSRGITFYDSPYHSRVIA